MHTTQRSDLKAEGNIAGIPVNTVSGSKPIYAGDFKGQSCKNQSFFLRHPFPTNFAPDREEESAKKRTDRLEDGQPAGPSSDG
jgi:hypothetical protein